MGLYIVITKKLVLHSLITLALMLLMKILYCQSSYFNNVYNPNSTWGACTSILSKNDTIIGCSITGDPNTGKKIVTFLRLDKMGNVLNKKDFKYPYANIYPGRSQAFQHNSDNGYSLCAVIEITSNNNLGYILKLNSQLDSIWMVTFKNNQGNILIIDGGIELNNGDFVITGEYYIGGYNSDLIIIRTNSKGREKWRKLYGEDDTIERGFGIIETSDGGLLVTGYSYVAGVPNYTSDPLVIKTDSLGNEEWTKYLGTNNYDDGPAFAVVSTDGNIVVGTTYGTYQGQPYPIPAPYLKTKLVKMDLAGEVIWERSYGSSWDMNYVSSISCLDDGSIITTGYAWMDTIRGGTRGWILKVNSYGDSIWYRKYAHYPDWTSDNVTYDIALTSDKGFVISGQAWPFFPGYDQELWIQKIDSAGCDEPGCDPTVRINENMELKFSLTLDIYPNPCYDWIYIKNPFGRTVESTINIYTNYGQCIYNKSIRLNQAEIRLSTKNWSKGIYYIKCSSASELHNGIIVKL